MEEHWRDIQESDYLASWDFETPTEELTIAYIQKEEAKIVGKPKKVIAHFVEKNLKCGTKVKPMILNNTNLKFLQENTGVYHNKDWKNIRVEISAIANTTKIGGKKRLVISKVLSKIEFDFEEFKKITDLSEAKRKASQQHKLMTPEQVAEVKKHIENLEKQ